MRLAAAGGFYDRGRPDCTRQLVPAPILLLTTAEASLVTCAAKPMAWSNPPRTAECLTWGTLRPLLARVLSLRHFTVSGREHADASHHGSSQRSLRASVGLCCSREVLGRRWWAGPAT